MQPHLQVLLLLIIAQNKEILGQKYYDFKLLHQWKQIEFKFASEEERSGAIANGTFNVGGVEPLNLQPVYDADNDTERIFITLPRFRPGVPAVLGILTNETRDGNLLIDPYPSWFWHTNPKQCNFYRIVSTLQVWADECNRLWVIDSGVIGQNFICHPQIMAFDLKTNNLLHRYQIPYTQHLWKSIYVALAVEVESRENACENTWVYVANSQLRPSLLVYSLKQNISWRIEDRSFLADLKYENVTVDGIFVEIDDGIGTVALSPATDGPQRKLRYHAMTSAQESWAYTKVLKNASNFKEAFNTPQFFHTYKHTRNQQSAGETIDKYGNVYFSLLVDIQIAKWNPKTIYKQENFKIIADYPEFPYAFPSLKVSPYKGGPKEALWVFSTKPQQYFVEKLNANETNFRIFVAKL